MTFGSDVSVVVYYSVIVLIVAGSGDWIFESAFMLGVWWLASCVRVSVLWLKFGGALLLIPDALSRLRTPIVVLCICLVADRMILIGAPLGISEVYDVMQGTAQRLAVSLRVVLITRVIDLVLILVTLWRTIVLAPLGLRSTIRFSLRVSAPIRVVLLTLACIEILRSLQLARLPVLLTVRVPEISCSLKLCVMIRAVSLLYSFLGVRFRRSTGRPALGIGLLLARETLKIQVGCRLMSPD